MAKVTVFVPTFNQAKFLPQSLDSILNQTREPDQVLVIDDCSTDNTSEVIKNYKNRVEYIRHKKNLGAVKTYNHGLAIAKGNYILMVPGDDWLKTQIIEKESTTLDSYPNVGLVYAQSMTVTDDKKELIVAKPAGNSSYVGRKNDFFLLLTQGDFIPFLTVMVRKTVYQKLGFMDENLPYLHDYEMWIRIAKEYPLAYIAEPLAYYRIHGSNLHKKRNNNLYFDEYLKVLKKNLDSESKTARLAYSSYYQKLAAYNFLEKDLKTGIINLIKSIKYYPQSAIKLKTPLTFAMLFKKNPKTISQKKATVTKW